MKKYFLPILIFLFSATNAFAQPSFEIAPYPEPDISNVNVTVQSGSIIVTADAYDVSGIYSIAVKIKNSSGGNVETQLLYDDGSHNDGTAYDGTYGAVVLTADYPDGYYTVDISAFDNFGYERYLNNIKSFSIGGNCQSVSVNKLCVQIVVVPNVTSQISSFVVSQPAGASQIPAGTNVCFEATLSYNNGDPISGQTITFTDTTSDPDNVLGQGTTNLFGVASACHYYPLDATLFGTRVIKARFEGNIQMQIGPAEATKSIEIISAGQCQTDRNYIICASIITSGGGGQMNCEQDQGSTICANVSTSGSEAQNCEQSNNAIVCADVASSGNYSDCRTFLGLTICPSFSTLPAVPSGQTILSLAIAEVQAIEKNNNSSYCLPAGAEMSVIDSLGETLDTKTITSEVCAGQDMESNPINLTGGAQYSIKIKTLACDGILINNHCWFAGDYGQSCSQVCLSHGMTESADCKEAIGVSASDCGAFSLFGINCAGCSGNCPVYTYSNYYDYCDNCYSQNFGDCYWFSWDIKQICACNGGLTPFEFLFLP